MSIYTSEIRSDLGSIDSAILQLEKPKESGDASLKIIRLVAGFLFCNVKLSEDQSLVGSLVVNFLIDDVLRINQLIQKKKICDKNIRTTYFLGGASYIPMSDGETESLRVDATRLNTISVDSRNYLTNAQSKISKELLLRVMSIASLCLVIGGMVALSTPLMIAGAVSYFFTHVFIHQTTEPIFDNSSKSPTKLHSKIDKMTRIIDGMNPQAA